jgi:hypothetical protein
MGVPRGWQRLKKYLKDINPVEAYNNKVVVVDASAWVVTVAKAGKAPLYTTLRYKLDALRLAGAKGVALVLDASEKPKRVEMLQQLLNEFGIGYMVSAPTSVPAEKVCVDLARTFRKKGHETCAMASTGKESQN